MSVYLVDLKEDAVRELPPGRLSMCLTPDEWEPGMYYVPLGALLIGAATPQDAKRQAEEIYEEKSLYEAGFYNPKTIANGKANF